MRILRKHSALLLRSGSSGAFDEGGKWVEGIAPVPVEIPCCIQPDFDSTLKKFLPDGVHEKDCRVIYTEYQLQGASEESKVVADKLQFEGKTFEVVEIQSWQGAGRIKAWMVVCVRVDEL